MNCAQALLQIVYWWHPLLWLANARIRRVREEAVDDAVMLALRDEAESYAPTLLEVAKLAFRRPLMSLGLVGIMESRSALRQRIERLVDFRAPRKAGLTFASFCGIFVFSAVALPMGQGPAPTVKDTAHIPAPAVTAPAPVSQSDNEQEILITAQIYQGRTISTENQISTFVLPPKPFAEMVRLFDTNGFAKISSPRVLTTSGKPAQMFVGNDSNHVSFSCEPVVLNESVELTLQGERVMRRGGDWVTNVFNAKNLMDNRGGMGITVQDGSGSNLVILAGVEILTNRAKGNFQQRLVPLERKGSTAAPIPTNAAVSPQLEMRTFRVDADDFYAFLQSHGGVQTNRIMPEFRNYFSKLGVNLDPASGETIFYNGLGYLFVKATKSDLDTIERVIKDVNQLSPQLQHAQLPPQVSTNATGVRSDSSFQQRLVPLGEKNAITATGQAQTLVQDGKLLYEMGKWDEAKTKFAEAFRLDRDNYTAAYYLNVIERAKLAGDSVRSTNGLAWTGVGRQALVAKLNHIRLDKFSTGDLGLPLREVLKQLAEQTKLRDPEGKGINFVINNSPELKTNAPADAGACVIKIPSLTNVRLADLLDAHRAGFRSPHQVFHSRLRRRFFLQESGLLGSFSCAHSAWTRILFIAAWKISICHIATPSKKFQGMKARQNRRPRPARWPGNFSLRSASICRSRPANRCFSTTGWGFCLSRPPKRIWTRLNARCKR